MHRRLARASRWGGRLEGGYAALRRIRPWGILGRVPTVEGSRVDLNAPNDWTAENMMAVRDQGLALDGPPPASVIPPVGHAMLRRALWRYLRELMEGRPAGAAEAAAIVLNIARCLYSLEVGRPSTTTEAAMWLRTRAPHLWPILSAALAMRKGSAGVADRRQVLSGLVDLKRAIRTRSGP